jgi:2-oxoglutarate ferredoxin oxidoreductase subunit gamma
MSQEAYTRFTPELKDGGVLLVEQDLVRISDLRAGIRAYSVPATRLAEELGRRLVLNIVMVGFFAAVTGLLDPEALRRAVADSVPAGSQVLNLRAFEKGFDYGLAKLHPVEEGGEEEHAPREIRELHGLH